MMLVTVLTWMGRQRRQGTSGGSQGDIDISNGGDRSLGSINGGSGWCEGHRYNDCGTNGRFWRCSGCRSCDRGSDRGYCIIDCTRWKCRGHRYNDCVCSRRDFAIGWSGIDCGASRVLLYSAVAHFGCGNGFYQTAVSRRGCSVPGRHAKIGHCRRARDNQLQR